ncbi:MAG: SDR family NAD(P)-dependent oxidoreductase [Bdellovibrionaceae bacterium]|nr:SDR family NAD(P)-dependent oxidoreductase [Pseudobdellovibrionaceae bacterium]NUM60261.1 SDR family NAD(P)-dependent oxidoreductase [Pseudobdellovibrionaceae bacterium]
MIEAKENWSLLGASRGLGLEFSKLIPSLGKSIELFLASRSINNFDFSKEDLYELYCEQIKMTNPHRIFYFAAGGTYGPYGRYEWKDHRWSMNVTFSFPAYLLNYFIKNHGSLKQIIFVGSQIAESKPDPHAAMYCAGKHALKGLVSSVQLENIPFELLLFSPGYMDTQMLPKKAWPREKGLAIDPKVEAINLLNLVRR